MGREIIYWSIVFLTFIYIIYKNKNSTTKILIILCFYSGLASFAGKSLENPYKILLVILSVFLLIRKSGLSRLNLKEKILLIAFMLFSASFFFSAVVNHDYFNLIFSQYGKYVTPICLFFVFNRLIIFNPENCDKIKALLFSLLTIQIVLTIAKVATIGMQETTVGSIAHRGGGPATILPILGFILLWFEKQGNLTRKDWVYILLLLLIGIVSFKRAVLFILPLFIFLFTYYVPRRLRAKHLLYSLVLLPFLFYAGVRLNPTLNKEGRIGGSFDIKFVVNYAQSYSFGKTSESSQIQLGQGRGGATLLILDKLLNGKTFSSDDIWGVGLKDVYTTDYEHFENENYGVNSKGAITGVFQTYLTAGFIGIIVTILLLISIIGLIKEPRIRITLALLIFWDYLFYSGLILRTQSLYILLFFIILFSNKQYFERLSFSSTKIKKHEAKLVSA